MIFKFPFLSGLLWFSLLLSVSAQDGELDPSIFDGTGMEASAPEPPEPGGKPESPEEGAGGDTDSAEPGGAEESEPADPSLPIPESTTPAVPEEASAGEEEESGLMEGESSAEEEPAGEVVQEEVTQPGSPAPVHPSSRAGEIIQTQERIAPGQAVDLPWDL